MLNSNHICKAWRIITVLYVIIFGITGCSSNCNTSQKPMYQTGTSFSYQVTKMDTLGNIKDSFQLAGKVLSNTDKSYGVNSQEGFEVTCTSLIQWHFIKSGTNADTLCTTKTEYELKDSVKSFSLANCGELEFMKLVNKLDHNPTIDTGSSFYNKLMDAKTVNNTKYYKVNKSFTKSATQNVSLTNGCQVKASTYEGVVKSDYGKINAVYHFNKRLGYVHFKFELPENRIYTVRLEETSLSG